MSANLRGAGNVDKQVFDELIRKHQAQIIELIETYVPNHDDALDVAQEAFSKAYLALPTFREESAFYTWLCRIAINTAKNRLSASNRRPQHVSLDDMGAEQYESLHGLADYGSPEEVAIRDETAMEILQAVECLPDEFREAFMLREVYGMSYEQIAHAMECEVGTAYSRVARAKEAIKSMLG